MTTNQNPAFAVGYTVRGEEIDDHTNRLIRPASSAVLLSQWVGEPGDQHVRDLYSFSVPTPNIALAVRDLLGAYLHDHTVDELHQLGQHLSTVTHRIALGTTYEDEEGDQP